MLTLNMTLIQGTRTLNQGTYYTQLVRELTMHN